MTNTIVPLFTLIKILEARFAEFKFKICGEEGLIGF